jgi:hypothetical protein
MPSSSMRPEGSCLHILLNARGVVMSASSRQSGQKCHAALSFAEIMRPGRSDRRPGTLPMPPSWSVCQVRLSQCRWMDIRADGFRPALWFRVSTDEVDLEIAVRPLGDLIAIGRPGEFLPTPGAAREYSPHNEWQNTVRTRMRSARLVIIRAGQGDHLLWECEQAFSMLSSHQLVFLILDIRADEYKNFATTIHARRGLVLPAIPNVFVLRWLFEPRSDPGMVKPGFIVFSEQWQAQFMPFKHSQRLVGEFQKALRPVFAAQGVAMGS